MPFAIKVILVLLAVLILEIYFVKRVVNSFKFLFPKVSLKKIKIVKWIFLIFVNIYPIIAIISWIYVIVNKIGYFQPPENIFFDYLVLYPFWVGTMIIVQSTLFFILIEIFHVVVYPFLSKRKDKLKQIKAWMFFTIFFLATIYVPLRILYDYNFVEINEYVIQKDDLPDVLDGFKITLISDVQADRYTDNSRLSNFIWIQLRSQR